MAIPQTADEQVWSLSQRPAIARQLSLESKQCYAMDPDKLKGVNMLYTICRMAAYGSHALLAKNADLAAGAQQKVLANDFLHQ